MVRPISILLCLLCLLAAAGVQGEEPAPGPAPAAGKTTDEVRQEVAHLIEQLDSERFYDRKDAAARLTELAGEARLRELLAAEFARVLVAADTSLEVRKQVELLARGLPGVRPEQAGEIPAAELDRLMRQLEDDSYGERLSALRRLEWYLDNSKSICGILVRLKQRLAEERLSADAPRWLERMYDRARAGWLLTDPAEWELPPVTPGQIKIWTEDLVRQTPASAPESAQYAARVAKRELGDLLARDEYVPQVKEAIEKRLAAGELSREGTARLQELLEMTRPAMVAEYWEGHRQLGTQHLLVNVPSTTEGALRPSHFDWVNDETAHCVSGSNLAPGEYPVGVAIPHPNREGAIFHLVSLPTPRRRMAYKEQSRTDESKRLAELSRRTLDRFLKLKRPLSRSELILLAQLDYHEVSRFAGEFFLLVDDRPLALEERPFVNQYLPGSLRLNSVMQRSGGRSSRHGILAAILAAEGTNAAVPRLLEAIAADRFLPPSAESPRRLEWIAALSIAQRDPWPDVDAWLGSLVERSLPLAEKAAPAPDLGATAAGLLLKRHQQQSGHFGLEPVNDELLPEVGLAAYRFSSDDARKQVVAWWAKQRKASPTTTPPLP